MDYSYYTVDDLSLPRNKFFHRGQKEVQFSNFEEAQSFYRSLPTTGVKSMGLTDGSHVLELVRCVPLRKDDPAGEDVLASDYRGFPHWKNVPEAAVATEDCIGLLGLRYALDGELVVPIAPQDRLPENLADKYLWPVRDGDYESAIRWAYVPGKGWVAPDYLKHHDPGYLLVLKYQVACVTKKGVFVTLEVAPWEYKLLALHTQERMKNLEV